MWETFLSESKYLINIIVAVVLGFAIGYERKMRSKEAGIRTHTIVCAGAALVMVISKYGFSDLDRSYDPARIAAQIVSGISFLGAGIIVYRRHEVKGLTTAAGVWATAAVGMAAGAGMYFLAIGASAIIILVQCLMHIRIRFFNHKPDYLLQVEYKEENGSDGKIKEIFGADKFRDITVKTVDSNIICDVVVRTNKEFSPDELNAIMVNNPFILFVKSYCEE